MSSSDQTIFAKRQHPEEDRPRDKRKEFSRDRARVIHSAGRPTVFPQQALRITNEISALLAEVGLPDDRTPLWRDILADFTHGSALATAMSARGLDRAPRRSGIHHVSDGTVDGSEKGI